jgi:hypothetical protein
MNDELLREIIENGIMYGALGGFAALLIGYLVSSLLQGLNKMAK